MIVITRNGSTVVYTGWRAWLIGAAALAVVLLVFTLTAVVLLGAAFTLGLLMLLAVPAMVVVGLLARLLGAVRVR